MYQLQRSACFLLAASFLLPFAGVWGWDERPVRLSVITAPETARATAAVPARTGLTIETAMVYQ